MAPPRLLLAGHSHLACLGVPVIGAGPEQRVVPVDPTGRFAILCGEFPRTDAYWDALVSHASTTRVALSWRGNQHNARFMILSQPFDFVLSSRPELPVEEATPVVAERAAREVLEPTMIELKLLLGRLRDAVGPRPIVLGTPPPKGDNEALRSLLSREPAFRDAAQRLGRDVATVPLSAPLLRFKLWSLLQDMMAEVARGLALPFWPSPPLAQCADGMLRREFWAEDSTHANRAYGALALQDYEERLSMLDG